MFETVSRRAATALVVLASIGILLMMLHITADVVGKYFFNAPVENTLEIVEIYYMGMVVVLPFAYIVHDEGHITVELFTRGMSPRNLLILDACVGVLTFAFMCAMTWKTGQEAVAKTMLWELRESGESTIVAWPTRWFLPVGCGFMALSVASRMVTDVQKIFEAR